MSFQFDIGYMKVNIILYVEALSILRFIIFEREKLVEKFEVTFLHWIENDISSIDKSAEDTKQDSILNRIFFRIKIISGIIAHGQKCVRS